MKILVTGTAGFIGFHLVKKLLERSDEFFYSKVIKDLSENLLDVQDKVYTRDIFNSDN